MGRGGGAGGGSHSSSGRSFSGGHSFSGRSGGGGSSFGRGSGAGSFFGSSPSRRSAPPPPPRHMPPPPPPGRPYRDGRTVIVNNYGSNNQTTYSDTRYSSSGNGYYGEKKESTPLKALVTLLIAMLMITFVCALQAPTTKAPVDKLPSTASKIMDYDDMIVDNLGWITEDGSSGVKKVKQSLEYFYKKTGVQPMFVLSDTLGNATATNYTASEIEKTLEAMYQNAFGTDEGHIIFAVLTNDGADNYSYISCLAGTAATQAIGDEQKEILYDAWDKQWINLNQTEADMVANTFKNAANEIMQKPSHLIQNVRNIFIILDVVLLIAIIILSISSNKTKRLEEENRHTEAVNEQYMKETRSESSATSSEDNDLLTKYT